MPTQQRTRNWINLNDPDEAVLQAGQLRNGKLVLVLSGIPPRSPKFQRALSELNFSASSSGSIMVRTLKEGDPIPLKEFSKIWENAKIEPYPLDEFLRRFRRDIQGELDRAKLRREKLEQQQNPEPESEQEITKRHEKEEQQRLLHEWVSQSRPLGISETSLIVYEHDSRGRFVKKEIESTGEISLSFERDTENPVGPNFLRANSEAETERCLRGLIQHMNDQASPVSLEGVTQTILGHLDLSHELRQQWVARGLENASLSYMLDSHKELIPSWDDTLKIQDLFTQLGSNAQALPMMLQAQRFIEKADSVALIGEAPLFAFALLGENTAVNTRSYEAEHLPVEIRPQLVNPEALALSESALLYADPNAPIENTINADTFALFSDQALAVLLTEHEPKDVLAALDQVNDAHVVQFIKAPPSLTQAGKDQYLCLIKRGDTSGYQLRKGRNPVPIKSWEELRAISDETLTRMGREDLSIFDEEHRAENVYQRPYMAFSQVGPATTMTPKNIQSPLHHALGKVEAMYGPIDHFVSGELGLGFNSMAERFSAEQVDAIGLGINALLTQRGIIIGDQTGVGKGRVLAALASWANMNDKPIIFLTDKSFLFSDLARDLKDIEEWSRFRPLITNAGGSIVDIMDDSKELTQAPTPEALLKIMQGKMESNHNIIFTTYSQMNIKDSEKSRWLLKQSEGAVLILDEAHVGAGSSSNVSRQIEAMADKAEGVVYSSATWAKDYKNLSIYKKVLPDSVNIAQVEDWLEKEGQAASEVFSSLLAMDGVFVRREHDSSQVKFQISVDEDHKDYNRNVVNQISKILGSMSMLSGETDNMIQRMNRDTRKTIQDARSARLAILAAIQDQLTLKTSELETLNERGPAETEEEQRAIDQRKNELQSEINEFRKQIRAQSNTTTSNVFKSGFGGTGKAISSVMRRSIAALSVPHAARLAIEQLENNRKPIISLEETGGAFINQIIEQEIERITKQVADIRKAHQQGELTPEQLESEEIAMALNHGVKPESLLRDIRLPTIQDMMLNLIEKLGIVKLDEIEIGVDEGSDRILTESTLSVSDFIQKNFPDEGTQSFIDQFNKGIQSIQEEIRKLPPLPISPFDALSYEIRKAGYSVGEISGRKFRIDVDIERSEELGYLVGTMAPRKKGKEEVVGNASGFNNGHIDVLMFNQSAATGMSVHSSPRFKDSRQRVHIQLQDLLNALLAEQTDGRSNRRGQLTPPIYLRPTLGLASEQRMIMAQNVKRKMLAAIVRSSGDNPSVIKDVPDLLSPIGDRVTQEYLLENSGIMNRLNLTMSDIERPYGLARTFTQLLVLLGDEMSTKILDDLEEAYHNAQLENKITNESNDIDFLDLKATEISSSHAWGPKEFNESMSSLDAPVMQKIVSYKKDRNPIQFDEVLERMVHNTAKLKEDERVRLMPFNSIQGARRAPDTLILAERASPESLQAALGFIAMVGIVERNHHENSKGQFIHLSLPVPGSKVVQNAAALVSQSGKSAKIWAFSSLDPDQDLTKTDEAESFILDLRQASELKSVLSHIPLFRLGQAPAGNYTSHIVQNEPMRQLFANVVTRTPVYQANRVKQVNQWAQEQAQIKLASAYPDIPILDISKAFESAATILQAKEIIGLSSIHNEAVSSVEDALALPEHNAVKEARLRLRFIEKILSQMKIGSAFTVDDQNTAYRYRSFFGGRSFLVTGIHLPEKGQEASLSKWKVELASYGAEDTVTVSASTLYRMQNYGQNHEREVFGFSHSNILYPESERIRRQEKDSFAMFTKGVVEQTKTMLVGNAYQAAQWAIASKKGRPVIYSDEKGGLHRAVEVDRSALFHGRLMDVANRINGKKHVKALITYLFENKDDIEYSPQCTVHEHYFALSFASATNLQQKLTGVETQASLLSEPRLPNAVRFIATGDGQTSSHAIDVTLKSSERNALRLRFLAALESGRNQARENDTPFPALEQDYHRVISVRGSKNDEQRTLRIVVPSGGDDMSRLAREQIIEAFMEANGAELISIPYFSTTSKLLEKELERYYDSVNQPNEQKYHALIERFKKRQAHEALMQNAFDADTVEDVEYQEHESFSLVAPSM